MMKFGKAYVGSTTIVCSAAKLYQTVLIGNYPVSFTGLLHDLQPHVYSVVSTVSKL